MNAELKDELMANLDGRALCAELGVQICQDDGTELRAPCPIHGGDNPTAFAINLRSAEGGQGFHWKCYTQCGGAHGDAVDLVMALMDVDFPAALRWLMDFCGVDDDGVFHKRASGGALAKCAEALWGERARKEVIPTEYLCEEFVARCKSRRNSYFNERGFPDWVLDLFEVGSCHSMDTPWMHDEFPNRAVIPIRSGDGSLVGISGRMVADEDAPGKYRQGKGSDRGGNLYGLHLARPHIAESGWVLVVEGFCDLWKCWMAGIENIVAIMGSGMTMEQMELVVGLSSTVVLALDPDKAGRKGSDKAVAAMFGRVDLLRLPFADSRDIGSMEPEEIHKLLNNAEKIICAPDVRGVQYGVLNQEPEGAGQMSQGYQDQGGGYQQPRPQQGGYQQRGGGYQGQPPPQQQPPQQQAQGGGGDLFSVNCCMFIGEICQTQMQGRESIEWGATQNGKQFAKFRLHVAEERSQAYISCKVFGDRALEFINQCNPGDMVQLVGKYAPWKNTNPQARGAIIHEFVFFMAGPPGTMFFGNKGNNNGGQRQPQQGGYQQRQQPPPPDVDRDTPTRQSGGYQGQPPPQQRPAHPQGGYQQPPPPHQGYQRPPQQPYGRPAAPQQQYQDAPPEDDIPV
jgi:5S rRNA maturation endonuclease (ribonuclease M5)